MSLRYRLQRSVARLAAPSFHRRPPRCPTLLLALLPLLGAGQAFAQDRPPEHVVPGPSGELVIGLVGHGSLYFRFAGRVVHVDPWSRQADYSALPGADLVLITHEHADHLDPAAIAAVSSEQTRVIASASCEGRLDGATIMRNGDVRSESGLRIEAVPAYNIVSMRPDGSPYHPRGNGNGYIISFGELRVYVAGDTENTPEMKALRNIDIAFLPMNQPFTMTPAMVADAASAFRPRILYPYHFNNQEDAAELHRLLQDVEGVELRLAGPGSAAAR